MIVVVCDLVFRNCRDSLFINFFIAFLQIPALWLTSQPRIYSPRLEAYVDVELPPPEMEAFRAHAANCPDCATAALALIETKAALRRAGQRYAAPPDFRARVLASVRAHNLPTPEDVANPSQRNRESNLPLWPRWALAAAALVLLASGLFFAVNRYQQPKSLAEFADLHVAALASANPVEVVSTDRHTVKPWFQGRIPFTFDLPELQGSPFTLTGGRVAYFHQEPGAHLIFAYQSAQPNPEQGRRGDRGEGACPELAEEPLSLQ